MRFLLKGVLYLAVVAVVALLAYAIFSDLPPPQHEVVLPVEAR